MGPDSSLGTLATVWPILPAPDDDDDDDDDDYDDDDGMSVDQSVE
jgi:hypothetical protein